MRQLKEDEQAVAPGAERESARETVSYEPGSGTVFVHGKEPGDERRTPVEVAPNSVAVPNRDDLQAYRHFRTVACSSSWTAMVVQGRCSTTGTNGGAWSRNHRNLSRMSPYVRFYPKSANAT